MNQQDTVAESLVAEAIGALHRYTPMQN